MKIANKIKRLIGECKISILHIYHNFTCHYSIKGIYRDYTSLANAAIDKRKGTFSVGINTLHSISKPPIVKAYKSFDARTIEKSYELDGGNNHHSPILEVEEKTVFIDGINMYVCHFSKTRIYYSPLRQFIDSNVDYRNIASRFLAYSDLNETDKYVKITFSEDFPCHTLPNGRIHQCIELMDGGLLVEVENGEELGNGCYVRQLYKIPKFKKMRPTDGILDIPKSKIEFKLKYINPIKVSPSVITNSSGKEFVSSYNLGVRLLQCWGLSMYGKKVLIAGYDQGGRNACVYYSDDNFETFKLIFNGASEDIQVDVPNTPIGRYPRPENVIPANSFSWNSTLNGNVHVHGVAYDPYYNRIWVTTGDGGQLNKRITGIFYTDDIGASWNFVSLNNLYPFVKNTQLLSIIPLKNCVLFTTDGAGDGFFRYNRTGKEKRVTIELVYQYLGNNEHECFTIPAGSYILPKQSGILTLFPYGTLRQDILDYTRCGVVYSPNGFSFEKIYQEKRPVHDLNNSVIHRRSIVYEYENYIAISAYNGGFLKLSF